MTSRALVLCLCLVVSLAACKGEPSAPAKAPIEGAAVKPAPEAAPPAPAQAEAAPEAPTVEAAPAGAPEEQAAPPDGGAAEQAPAEPVDPDRRLLSAYREIYCLQKKNDQMGVMGVWQRYGYDSAGWAKDVQTAAKRAQEDPKGFGARWTKIAEEPCP